MRYSTSLMFLCLTLLGYGQNVNAGQIIPTQIVGCWQAGDGGMRGQYCFDADGLLRIKPTGRMAMQRAWKWDAKKELLVISKGSKPIRYSVELLNDSAFVLLEVKHDVRLVGKRK